jgi:hypothetical protein
MLLLSMEELLHMNVTSEDSVRQQYWLPHKGKNLSIYDQRK